MAASGKRWAGLLRAVNVGGRKLTMAALRKSAEAAGFTDVATLLASGNLVFTATGGEQAVRTRLQRAISDDAGFEVDVLLRTEAQLGTLLKANPFPGGDPAKVLVCFLDGPAPAGLVQRAAEVSDAEPVEPAGTHVWVHYVNGVGRSKLSLKLPDLVRPRVMTARNVNTVTKLAELL